jgi:DNA invertase Pin-like site-specific DNA recombinase
MRTPAAQEAHKMMNSDGDSEGCIPSDAPTARRPRQIRAEHLAKLAIVYLRQSTLDQVQNNVGSTYDQRALALLPREWGWPDSRIREIDNDLGITGTSASKRAGFQELLRLIDADDVGLVLAQDVSRISRNTFDSELFLKKVIRGGVLLYVQGQLFDTATESLVNVFGLKIQSLLAWLENEQRAQRFKAAKLAKIKRGFAVSQPPIGYIKATRGKWILDPDVGVQEAIRRIFDLYLILRSTRKVEAYFHEHRLLFPSRRHGALTWKLITGLDVSRVLRSPMYTGDYVFARRRQIRSNDAHAE